MRRAALLLLAALALTRCARAPVAREGADLDAEVAVVRDALAGCPLALPDAALRDLAVYERCRLPASVVALVRNDYADGARGPERWEALRAYAGAVPRATFEAQLARVVDPAGVLKSWIAVDARANALLPDPVLAPRLAIPFAPGGGAGFAGDARPGALVSPPRPDLPYRPVRRAELRGRATSARPLAGLRVAIDPGHAGGPFGAFEDRRIAWRPAPGAAEVVVQEGDLSLRTALELRAKLAARGAEVLLTRDAPLFPGAPDLAALRPAAEALLGHIALDPAYAALERRLAPDDRLRLHAALALHAVKKVQRFASLLARAEGAARAGADLLLSIHFNAGTQVGAPIAQELVAMVAGNVGAERAYDPSHRARALRSALDVEGLDASTHLAALCLAGASRALGVAVATRNHYPDHLPLVFADGTTRGVDAWDGALLRYADMPAALVEGPYMTDPEELGRLAAALAAPRGTEGTRTERFAEGLARGVEEWARRWREGDANPFGAEAP
ncbi:MAG: N-acetylmuramoyl-L-alanine amidase [Anaeromyxobacteraceae bacterium]